MNTKVIKVAVLVTDEIRPKDLSTLLDFVFEDLDCILQFAVDGFPENVDMSEAALWRAMVDGAADSLTEEPPE